MARIFLTGGSGFIGSEIARAAVAEGHEIGNIDLVAPHDPAQRAFWTPGDIRDLPALSRAVEAFRPELLIHLASDTDVQVTALEQFTTTIDGTRNVLAVAAATPGLSRFVHISTQFVVRPGVSPPDEEYLEPYTVYGEAKAETERLVRATGLTIPWLIVRPTIIWGPNHPSFRDNIFRHIASGAYLHPTGREKTMRAFGYVTNTAAQILALALRGGGNSGRRVFYAGDDTIDYDWWADAFSLALAGRRARRIPKSLLALLGRAGDLLKKLGLPAPIDSGRAFRMSTSSAIDLAPTHAVTGPPAVPFDVGVERTLAWLREREAAGRA